MSDPQERVYFLPVEHGRYVSDCCYIRERCIDYICPRVIPTLWHSGHCNNSTKGNPQVVCAFCKKLGYFSHLILALLTYWFFLLLNSDFSLSGKPLAMVYCARIQA